jgi:hypothetical protein
LLQSATKRPRLEMVGLHGGVEIITVAKQGP